MTPDDLEKKLFVAESAKYGDKYVEHVLEQYKTYVKSAEKISAQRQKANEYFLAINTALVAVLGFIATKTDAHIVAVLSGACLACCNRHVLSLVPYRALVRRPQHR